MMGTVIWECETPKGQTFRVRPRGTHEYRTELFQNGNDYIGKQLTVRYQELTDDGVQGSQWESQFVTNKRPNGPRMSNKRIDLTLYEEHTKGDPNDNPTLGEWWVMVS